jgi:predicted transglutaminase-like cysteine proteinase
VLRILPGTRENTLRTGKRTDRRIIGAMLAVLAGLAPVVAEDGFRDPQPLLPSADPAVDLVEPAAGETAAVSAETAVPLRAGAESLGSFDSVAISARRIPIASKWRQVTQADFTALFTGQCASRGLEGCSARLTRRLRAARDSALDRPALEQLRVANAAVNDALGYRSDRSNWGRGDHWATPAEMAERGAGDCEDYAIAKFWLLRSLGFAPEQLQLVVLRDSRRGLYHAVLVAHVSGKRYVLDNLSTAVRPDTAFPNYLPIVSFVGGRSYLHGFRSQRADMAQMPADLAAVFPG